MNMIKISSAFCVLAFLLTIAHADVTITCPTEGALTSLNSQISTPVGWQTFDSDPDGRTFICSKTVSIPNTEGTTVFFVNRKDCTPGNLPTPLPPNALTSLKVEEGACVYKPGDDYSYIPGELRYKDYRFKHDSSGECIVNGNSFTCPD